LPGTVCPAKKKDKTASSFPGKGFRDESVTMVEDGEHPVLLLHESMNAAHWQKAEHPLVSELRCSGRTGPRREQRDWNDRN
jgi:hypothetical protein